MGLNYIIAIRTANRAPKRNYLGQTVRNLLSARIEPSRLHLFPTDPDVAWLGDELDYQPDIMIHVPDRRYNANQNGVRCIEALEWAPDADWIGLFEDDLAAVAGIPDWLEAHADPFVHVYRLFALPGTQLSKHQPGSAWARLREMRGSQAVFLRRADALNLLSWSKAKGGRFRPADAPFQDRPDRGFDKLIGYWALDRWPDQLYGLVASPMLVNHVGRESLLHTHGVSNDAQFAGAKR